MKADLVLKALKKAEGRRNLRPGAIIHSDRGSQYAGTLLRKPLKTKGYEQRMSRKGDCYDNAFAESFFSPFKAELIQGGIFDTFSDAYSETFDYLECYYNSRRRHSALGYLSPDHFEKIHFLT
jgi:transposase InsO family protein